jgi:hypothetical protein
MSCVQVSKSIHYFSAKIQTTSSTKYSHCSFYKNNASFDFHRHDILQTQTLSFCLFCFAPKMNKKDICFDPFFFYYYASDCLFIICFLKGVALWYLSRALFIYDDGRY